MTFIVENVGDKVLTLKNCHQHDTLVVEGANIWVVLEFSRIEHKMFRRNFKNSIERLMTVLIDGNLVPPIQYLVYNLTGCFVYFSIWL